MASDTIRERSEEIAEEFAFLPDWTSRYDYLISLGDELPWIAEDKKTKETYVEGCQSDVWIRIDIDPAGQEVHLYGDTNAKITTGLVALLIRLLNYQPPEAIVETDLDVLDEIGLWDHLSAQRRNGLAAMIDQIKARTERRNGAGDRSQPS